METIELKIGSQQKEKIQKMFVELSAEVNPDFMGKYIWNKKIKSKLVAVSSPREASKICRQFIETNELGGGNWTGGRVYDKKGGKVIAYISYNGRIWNKEPN